MLIKVFIKNNLTKQQHKHQYFLLSLENVK